MASAGPATRTDDLEEVRIWEGMTVRAVVETLNKRLREHNLQFVETPNEQDCLVTFVVGHPHGPDPYR